MTMDELAAWDRESRRRVLARALVEERRGLAIRAAQSAPTGATAANVRRLEAELAEAGR